jgi:dTDP-4-amino-4,6-dideoxygalactose transaminase
VLRVKLKHLDDWTDHRRTIADVYTQGLAESGLILPYVPEWAEPVWHLYVVRSAERDALQARLDTAGIGTLIHYPIAPHMQDAYAGLGIAADALPLARQLATEVLSLPIGPQLGLKEADVVVRFINDF